VPDDEEARIRLLGLTHEVLGEGGLMWSVRLLLVHASFTSDGREGWPLRLAQYLAPKYGYAPERIESARGRSLGVLDLLDRTLRASGRDYFLGDRPTALDVYVAAGLGPLAPLPHDQCPMLAPVRHAFETLDPAVRAAVPASLLRHRELMFQRHLTLPVRM
jgi:glutathione S-transferase